MVDSGGAWRTRIRAVVVHPERDLVLADRAARLPELEVPGRLWTGAPSVAVEALRATFGVDAVQLWCSAQHEDDASRTRQVTLVLAARGEPEASRLAWAAADAAGVPAGLLDGLSMAPPGRPPWRHRAWFDTASGWIAGAVTVAGPVTQVRVCELSCVLRAPTPDGVVFFKAVAESPLFVNEGAVLRELAPLFPGPVPQPLAVDVARRWMLLPDLGTDLRRQQTPALLEDVLRTFARMQIGSIPHVDRLLGVGLIDRRLDWLARRATGWLTTVDLSRWVSADEAAAVRACGPRIARLCDELAALPVPATLAHGDLHLGNVAGGGGGYRFFDWTDACVMHPFLDLLEAAFLDDPGERERVVGGYLAEWAGFAPSAVLRRAWRLAEPLTAFNQAVSYVTLASVLEPGTDLDGLHAETGDWLRRLVTACGAAG